MSELSHFENLSAKTPMVQPVAIVIGATLLPALLWLINVLAPSDAVGDLRKQEAKNGKAEAPIEMPMQGDVEDI